MIVANVVKNFKDFFLQILICWSFKCKMSFSLIFYILWVYLCTWLFMVELDWVWSPQVKSSMAFCSICLKIYYFDNFTYSAVHWVWSPQVKSSMAFCSICLKIYYFDYFTYSAILFIYWNWWFSICGIINSLDPNTVTYSEYWHFLGIFEKSQKKSNIVQSTQ